MRDQGVFTKYPGFSPMCLIYKSNPGVTHGELTAQRALEVSCNYFFYELGSRMTIEMLNETANGLGLGVPTGIELTEKVGWARPASTPRSPQAPGFWPPSDRPKTGSAPCSCAFTLPLWPTRAPG